jgi:hypothetical protein
MEVDIYLLLIIYFIIFQIIDSLDHLFIKRTIHEYNFLGLKALTYSLNCQRYFFI